MRMLDMTTMEAWVWFDPLLAIKPRVFFSIKLSRLSEWTHGKVTYAGRL